METHSGGRPRRGHRWWPAPRFPLLTVSLLIVSLPVVTLLTEGLSNSPSPQVRPCAEQETTDGAPGPASVWPALRPRTDPTSSEAQMEGVARSAVAAVDAMAGAGGSPAYGVAVLDRQTDRVVVGADGSTPFYSASVAKLLTAVAVLHRSDTSGAPLAPRWRDELWRALSVSDDDAMDALWAEFSGPATVTQTIGLAGLRDSRPPRQAHLWELTEVSARDVVAVYRYVLTDMSPAGRTLIMDALTAAGDSGADGFNQRFGLLREPRLEQVAAKQGWMATPSGMYLHSTGAVGGDRRLVVALLTRQPAGLGFPAARDNVTEAAEHLLASMPAP